MPPKEQSDQNLTVCSEICVPIFRFFMVKVIVCFDIKVIVSAAVSFDIKVIVSEAVSFNTIRA